MPVTKWAKVARVRRSFRVRGDNLNVREWATISFKTLRWKYFLVLGGALFPFSRAYCSALFEE